MLHVHSFPDFVVGNLRLLGVNKLKYVGIRRFMLVKTRRGL